MIFDMAKGVAALALVTGCLLGPALGNAQETPASEATSVKSGADKAPADGSASAATDTAASTEAEQAASQTSNESKPDEVAAQDTATSSAADQAASQGSNGNEGQKPVAQDAASADSAQAAKQTPDQVAASVKAAFEKEFPGITLDGVRATRFAGVYELRIGSDLLYTNEKVEYVLQGTLIDARNKEDLTAKRIDELTRVAFDSLPLESAIKQVKGDGSRKMAVFEDPNCGYCKRLHQTLEGMDNYTVYTLLFPILSPDSTVKARNIWCAADRVQAWRDQMLKNQAPPNAQCETPIEANLAFGRKLLVRGTPAIIFEDGSRVNGALPRDALEKKLDEATAAVAAAANG